MQPYIYLVITASFTFKKKLIEKIHFNIKGLS